MFGITTILASAWRTCKAGKHATALSDSLRRGSFCSGRIVRQTRVEFRPSNPEGSRGFESAPLRQSVWHVSLLFREAMKSARGARFTRVGGPGECQRPWLTAKIDQNSLFALLACPSAKRSPREEHLTQATTPA